MRTFPPLSRPSLLFAAALLLPAVLLLAACGSGGGVAAAPDVPDDILPDGEASYPLVDTGQTTCFDAAGPIAPPAPGAPFHGQDAQYEGDAPRFRDQGDGTVLDLVTGLVWQQDPGPKTTYAAAVANVGGFRLAGHDDWRIPTLKELYSLIDFGGVTGTDAASSVPYLDAGVFVFTYGDATGERFIDSQMCSSTEYVSTTMGGAHTVFGVNFADGRIKGYPTVAPDRREKTFYVHHVRGAPYGANDFVDNADGTITDRATGLTWTQMDSGAFGAGASGDGRLTWEEALAWAEALVFAGHDDWKLPDAKELQSLVDYTRAPDTHGRAAIDPFFSCTPIVNEAGETDYAFYWTSTTHQDGPEPALRAVYVSFGRALGWMDGRWMDVHGAGAQRSDPKVGDPAAFPHGLGPQGDAIRIRNLARAVRRP